MAGKALLDQFSALDDPRQAWKVVYPLPEILLTVLCGTMAGAEDFVEIERWAKRKLEFLRRFLRFERGIPSHDTLNDVLNALPAEVFSGCFVAWVEGLRDGDLVNFDITLEKNGYIADSSKTYLIGEVSDQARQLTRITYEAMCKGIEAVRPGARLGDIGHAIERHARAHRYSVVREYCGHGIGREMHEPPEVLHWGKAGTGLTLREGMTFTIEPMLNRGTEDVRTLGDGWTVVTRDGQLSAQFEHTVAVTRDGVRVLTLRPEELHLSRISA